MNAEDMPKVLDAIRESELPVSEVVKYIKHGPMMHELIRGQSGVLKAITNSDFLPEEPKWAAQIVCNATDTFLAKLEEA